LWSGGHKVRYKDAIDIGKSLRAMGAPTPKGESFQKGLSNVLLDNNFFDADSVFHGIVPCVAHFNCSTYGNNEEK
jgi:hypothetical protein